MNPVSWLSFSADSRRLLVTHGGKVLLWDCERGQLLWAMDGWSYDPKLRAVCSASGARVAVPRQDEQGGMYVSVMDLEGDGRARELFQVAQFFTDSARAKLLTNGLQSVLTNREVARIAGAASAEAFVTEDEVLVRYPHDERGAELWNVREARTTLAVTNLPLFALAWSADRRWLAGQSYSERLTVFDLVTGQRRSLPGHVGMVESVAFSPDGILLASGAQDQTIRLWSTTDWKPVAVRRGQEGPTTSLAFSPDGKWISSGAANGSVMLWPALETTNVPAPTHLVSPYHLSPDGRRMVAARRWPPGAATWHSEGLVVCDLDTQQTRVLADLPGLHPVGFTADGREVVSASSAPDRPTELRAWDWVRGSNRLLFSCDAPAHWPDRRTISLRGRYFACRLRNKPCIRLWDMAEEKLLQEWPEPTDCTDLTFSFDERFLACISQIWPKEMRLVVRAVPEGRVEFQSERAPIGSASFAFSPDGAWLAHAVDRKIHLYDTRTWRQHHELNGHANRVNSVAFSPDGLSLASCAEDRTVRLWQVGTGREVLQLSVAPTADDPMAQPRFVAFGGDSETIFCGTWGGAAHFWSARELNR